MAGRSVAPASWVARVRSGGSRRLRRRLLARGGDATMHPLRSKVEGRRSKVEGPQVRRWCPIVGVLKFADGVRSQRSAPAADPPPADLGPSTFDLRPLAL